MKRNNEKSQKQSNNNVSNCNKTNVRNSNNVKNNSNKKITGFEESKSFELDDDNENSFELK